MVLYCLVPLASFLICGSTVAPLWPHCGPTVGFSYMPNRILREGIMSSGPINKVSEAAETLYVRMLVAADDFGLVELTPEFLKARCLPLRSISYEDIEKRVAELTAGGREGGALVWPYEADGKRLGAVAKWDQRRFALRPKFPMPPWGNAHIRGGYVDPRVQGEPKKHATPAKKREPRAGKPNGAFDLFYSAYPRKVNRKDAERAWLKLSPDEKLQAKIMQALEEQKASEDWRKEGGKFIPYPSTWLNKERWDDQLSTQQGERKLQVVV